MTQLVMAEMSSARIQFWREIQAEREGAGYMLCECDTVMWALIAHVLYKYKHSIAIKYV